MRKPVRKRARIDLDYDDSEHMAAIGLEEYEECSPETFRDYENVNIFDLNSQEYVESSLESDELYMNNFGMDDTMDNSIHSEYCDVVEEDSSDDGKNVDYKILAYTQFFINEGLSNGTLKRLDSLMSLLYDVPPPISYKKVLEFVEETKKKEIHKIMYYCSTCGTEKKEKRESCPNCLKISRNILDTVTMVLMNFEDQIKRMIERYGEELIITHQQIHSRKDILQCTDIRRYPGYRDLMETCEEFQSGQVNLICTMSSDGAKFKRLSRRECTPVLMKVEGFSLEAKKSGKTMALVSMSYAEGGIKKILVDTFVEKSFEKMRNLNWTIEFGKKSFNFRIVIMSYLSDMKEQHSLTGLPNWNQTQGCANCYVIGTKKQSGKITFCDSETALERSDDSMRMESTMGTHGFTAGKLPVLYRYLFPTSVCLDPFHVKSVGVCKYYLQEVLKPSNWENAKLKVGVLQSINECLSQIKQYTYDRTKIQNLKRLGKCTGRETEKLSIYTCGLIGWFRESFSNEFNVFSLGLYHVLHFLGKLPVNPASLRLLLDSLYELQVQFGPQSITIKFHVFYKHLQDHEEQFGHLHTTEPFERQHKFFMTSVHYQTTNSEQSIVSRYTASQLCTISLLEMSGKLSKRVQKMIEGSMKTQSDRFIDLTTKQSNVIPIDFILPEHRPLLARLNLPENCHFFKRIHYNSNCGQFVTGCEKYWSTKNTSISLVSFSDPINGTTRFGSVQLIFQKNGDLFVVLKQYELEPMQLTLKEYYDKTMSPLLQKIVNLCLEFPVSFGRITSESFSLVPLSMLLCPASLVNYKGNVLIKC